MQFLTISILTCACWLMSPFLDLFNVSSPHIGSVFTVVIDPGHGGRDGGCLGAPINEKDIVLDMALQLGSMIQHSYPEVKVVYTRDTDVFIELHKRAKIATAHHADLFISIHCNSLPQAKQVKGSETYVMGLSNTNSNLEVAKRENEAILLEEDYQRNYAGYDPNSVEGHILLSMVQNRHLEQSLNFAAKVEAAIHDHGHGRSRGVKQAGFVVLREATVPSVLVETGYLTNTEDNEYLQSEEGKTAMATSMFVAFAEYWAEQQGKPYAKPELAASKVLPMTVDQAIEAQTPRNVPSNAAPKGMMIQEEIVKSESMAASDRLKYHLQLAASKKLINTSSGKWSQAPLAVEVKKEGEYYKYLSPAILSLSEAEELKQQYRAAGFSDAFIVAYQQGQRVQILK